jgi:hypothetical protein
MVLWAAKNSEGEPRLKTEGKTGAAFTTRLAKRAEMMENSTNTIILKLKECAAASSKGRPSDTKTRDERGVGKINLVIFHKVAVVVIGGGRIRGTTVCCVALTTLRKFQKVTRFGRFHPMRRTDTKCGGP